MIKVGKISEKYYILTVQEKQIARIVNKTKTSLRNDSTKRILGEKKAKGGQDVDY